MSTSHETLVQPSFPLPTHRTLYYGGAWHAPEQHRYADTCNPATGEPLCQVADSSAVDAAAAVRAARQAFAEWRRVAPRERAILLRQIAEIVRRHAEELAFLDALNSGNPIS